MPTIDLQGKRVATLLPKKFTQGKEVAWTDDLFREGQPPKVGEQSGLLTIVRVLPSTEVRFQNLSTFTLRDGQIAAQGVWTSDMNYFTLAITGGTGKYKRIRGEIEVTLDPGDYPPASYTATFRIKYKT